MKAQCTAEKPFHQKNRGEYRSLQRKEVSVLNVVIHNEILDVSYILL